MTNLKQSLRSFLRNPTWTAAALLCLTLGIGASTSVFSVINNLLLRPLPVRDIDSVAYILSLREGFDPYGASLLEYEAYLGSSDTVEQLGLGQQRGFNLTGDGDPQRLSGAAVSHGYLEVLGIEPARGRLITAADDQPGAEAVALIGYSLWQSRFGGDEGVLGRSLRINDRPHEVIGVLPQGFDLPSRTEMWTPLAIQPSSMTPEEKSGHAYYLVGRLRPSVTMEQVRSELRSITERLHQDRPRLTRGWFGHAIPLRQQITGDLEGYLRPALWAVAAACLFVLLIACANVANLLLARSRKRLPEVALRSALGARRSKVLGQFLSEGLLLALVGGGAGIALAYLLTGWLLEMSPVQSRAATEVFQSSPFDWRVTAAALALTALTGLAAGLLPARRALGRANVSDLLQRRGKAGAGQGSDRMLSGLLVVQIAFAVLLLSGAGLMVRSFQALSSVDFGFQLDNRLSLELSLPEARYPDFDSRKAFLRQLLQKAESLPGVLSADITNNIPLDDGTWDAGFRVEGAPEPDPSQIPITAHRLVSPGYLQTIGVKLLEGRLLREGDREESRPVVVVSREFARRAWPGQESVLGRRVRIFSPDEENPWMTVVGVVEDVKEDRPNFRIDRPVWYIPYWQRENQSNIDLVVHSRLAPQALGGTLRQAVWEIDPDQPVSKVITFEENIESFLGPERFSALLMGFFALGGLALAAIGLYGVLSYSVGQRRQEIGVRLALGASPVAIVRQFLREGMTTTLLGLLLGLASSTVLAGALAGTVYGVELWDLTSTGLVIGVLLACAALAAWLPARRASRLDPTLALRAE
ncbi:MAG TPA: ABC transporter permease [Acidobacteriota bacterium]|nr:ABC transporter permease [Acidobacteriota bacterium]